MKVYRVGGAVRDELLGLTPHEHDYVVVGATPEAMLALGFQQVGKDFPVFLHPQSKEEYALARTERKSGRGYTGFSCYADPDVTLEEDLQRRDLTINAIAMADDGSLIDPYGGRRDIEERVLRHVSAAFTEDPLRVLRLARFAARFANFGFTIAPETGALMREMVASGELTTLTPERIWMETRKALATPNPARYFQVLQEFGALAALVQSPIPTAPLLSFRALTAKATQPLPSAHDDYEEALVTRYCLAYFDLQHDVTLTKSVHELWRVPNLCQKIADATVHVCQQFNHRHAALTATELLQILSALDSFRRPALWQQTLHCVQTVFAAYPEFHDMRQRKDFMVLSSALEQLQSITAADVIASGFVHQEISLELKRRRLQFLEQALATK
ncbi:multifunctional CCA tRNA nucleotidyl transferase/2'3'-cyclic phosphodiesterase/2'nucleotidase/phosphatase [Aliidiomarina haloalkalitolerans]|uniref:Multifunctional CCA tRNA nucleotidyl transferase/2'3'-cyclic phosphodiesterase/2'nucleotidase/phosphatase n=1 Tax=Aliidiomarina haloalkalitolerans TaxID=859059 RepID=A0A432VQE2_9GAMM|nr:multifunctional CCA tRNA nucleotidyl transferase/2'3'-cyclic phosphodiesterase/2'nucleotidase/phosphatase [Aliidiomarina haloalkalitolerans]RUO18387.1 multifunctional CCA tRNA nucleotidyl transferase/2'3'-cyclic phosphodiesterase/2'nucleotidase/phosphatase [Aliidiomarina haloalkalitolerans]